MKWFDRWFAKKCQKAWDDARGAPELVGQYSNKPVSASREVDSNNGLDIKVQTAIGGRIVTFRHYDHKIDRYDNRIYIVPEEMDFERELGKMITLESMRG